MDQQIISKDVYLVISHAKHLGNVVKCRCYQAKCKCNYLTKDLFNILFTFFLTYLRKIFLQRGKNIF